MADLESVISNAIADAGGGEGDTSTETPETTTETVEETTETPETVETTEVADEGVVESETTPEVDATTGKPVEKPAEKPAEKVKTPEDEQFDKDMAELGFKPPKEGERENRLPHSRVKVMIGKYGKKLQERHNAVIQAKDAEYAPLREKSESTDNVDRLIVSDPDRYIGILANLHPTLYGKFVKGGQAEGRTPEKPVVKASEAVTALGPRPEADHKFEDGSMGYSPEQYEKREAWTAAKAKIEAKEEAKAEALAEIDKRFGPMEKAFQGREARNKDIQNVRTEIAGVHEAYGKDFVDKHEDAIVAAMKANPKLGPRQAADKVLLPLLRADRQKLRDEVTAEMQKRPAAARKAAPGPTTAGKVGKESSGDPITDAITNAVATIRG